MVDFNDIDIEEEQIFDLLSYKGKDINSLMELVGKKVKIRRDSEHYLSGIRNPKHNGHISHIRYGEAKKYNKIIIYLYKLIAEIGKDFGSTRVAKIYKPIDNEKYLIRVDWGHFAENSYRITDLEIIND